MVIAMVPAKAFGAGIALLAFSALAGPLVAAARAADSDPASVLEVTGMTFVRSRGDARELVVRARYGLLWPDTDIAKLEEVEAVVTDAGSGRRFEMHCDRAELDVENNDFRAEGNVHGVMSDGRSYSAPWVRYEHEKGVLYSDGPVVLVDDAGTFRGDGFRYLVEEGRFRLLGNVSVVQTP
jgi:LPS export ABC transporter protein LptC